MQALAAFQVVREHREELLREADRSRLVRELRAARREERLQPRGRVRATLQTLRIRSSSLPASRAL
jgi:hypothetical protein